MNGTQDPGLLSARLQAGAARCAQRLARMCRAPWSVASLAPNEQALGLIAVLLEGITEDTYGSYCSMPGAAFMVLFDRKSGMRVSQRFTGVFSDRFDALEDLELPALAEVSNIIANAMASGLSEAEAGGRIISIQEPMLDNTRGLVQAAFRRFTAGTEVALACVLRLECPELGCGMTMLVLLGPAPSAGATASPAGPRTAGP